jgi:hypothetical protein
MLRALTASGLGLNLSWGHHSFEELPMRTIACGSCGAKLALPKGLSGKLCQCVRCGALFDAPVLEPPVPAAHSPATPVLVTTRPLDPPREAALPVVVQEKPPFNLVLHFVAGLAFTVLIVFGVCFLMYRLEALEEARLGTAKGQLRMLTEACDNYNLNNGSFPPSLHALAQQQPNGGKPLVEPVQLVDPFGQPYGYDPSGARNGGMHADIWVNRPGGKRIGNWPGQR